MASELIHVTDNSNLGQILDEASERPLRIERDGVVYRVSVDNEIENLRAGYDPDAVIAAVDRAAGTFPGHAEELIEFLYEARRLGSRPASRP